MKTLSHKYWIGYGVLLAFTAALLWYGMQHFAEQQGSDEKVMAKLESMIVLPQEVPTIATVTDSESLLDQPFFRQAQNGDKVILYSQARRAYLFRPSENKIIDITILQVEGQNNAQVPVFQVNE